MYQLEQRLVGCEKSQAGKSEGLEDARKELEQLQVQHKKEIARFVVFYDIIVVVCLYCDLKF